MEGNTKSIETASAAMELWHETVGERLLRPLCPIYSESAHRPEPVGSGFLVRVDELIFLVSAAHVVDDVGKGPRYFGAGEQILPLPAVTFTTPLPPSGRRADDLVDIGYWILDPAMTKLISSADTLRVDQLDLVDASDIALGSTYYLTGYPESRQPRRLQGDQFIAKPLHFVTEELGTSAYSYLRRSRNDYLLVDYSKTNFFSGLHKQTGPDLYGVSGGSIWRLSGSIHVQPQRPVLTGVVTAWRLKTPQCVIASRIRLWLEHASANFPSQFRNDAATRRRV